jgi:ribosomal protein L33
MSPTVRFSVAVEVKLINHHVNVSNRSTIDKMKYAKYDPRCPDMILHSCKSSTVTFLSWYPCDITHNRRNERMIGIHLYSLRCL